eukprot:8202805-Karenia_brevis.AAC.1
MESHSRIRPNRSAAQRREQQRRADTRASARLLSHAQSLQHRGSQTPYQFGSMVASFTSQSASPSFVPLNVRLGALEQQLQNISVRLSAIDTHLGILTASSAADIYQQQSGPQHTLEGLVDAATLARIRQLQRSA